MDRKEILNKLSQKEITSEEAEKLLNENNVKTSDGPVYEETWGEQQSVKVGNRGCLVFLITAVLGFVLFIVLGALCVFGGIAPRAVQMERNNRQMTMEIRDRIRSSGITANPGHIGVKIMTEEERKAETDRIRKMIKDGTITEEEGKRLLKALEETRKSDEEK